MKTTQRLLVVFAASLVMLSSTGCDKLKARDHLNKGVQAYKNSKFEQAIDHFQQAVALDPTLINARLYLATAFAQQYIPGPTLPRTIASPSRRSIRTSRCCRSIQEHQQHQGHCLYLFAAKEVRPWPRSITRRRPRLIPTIPSRITRWP